MTLILLLAPVSFAADPEVGEAPEVTAEQALEEVAAEPAVTALDLSLPATTRFEATVAPPVLQPGGLAPVMGRIGSMPVATEDYTPDMAEAGLWQSRWDRALYPHQVTETFPGMDETPLNMVGRGLGCESHQNSSFTVPDE